MWDGNSSRDLAPSHSRAALWTLDRRKRAGDGAWPGGALGRRGGVAGQEQDRRSWGIDRLAGLGRRSGGRGPQPQNAGSARVRTDRRLGELSGLGRRQCGQAEGKQRTGRNTVLQPLAKSAAQNGNVWLHGSTSHGFGYVGGVVGEAVLAPFVERLSGVSRHLRDAFWITQSWNP